MTLTKPYEATFYIGNDSKKTFSFLFDEVSENFIKVIVKRIDGTIYTPTFSVDMELKEVVFGEDEITPTADDIICIYRDTPTIQDTQFNTLQGYNAKALENILSKIVAMIQEMKASGFSTQILQGEPWGLDLIKPDDDGASVQIDYQARVLKKGLYFKMSDGNLQASANGVDFVQMPKSAEVKEFRHRLDADGNVHFEYRVDKDWIAVSTGADVSGIKSQVDKNTADIITINGKLSAVDTQIDANADAILKTREDYIQADSEIHQILNSHTSELTTLRGNQASLGDQVAGIEQKIPESASGTNHLITKQQLLDEEMDIRDDLNEMASELQTQITAQAAEIATKQDKLTAGDNIVISGNVISATGAGGGAGFDMQVVDQLPATGKKGVIYLVPKDGAAPDVYDEYVWIDATQTFELIGTTQVDLSDYAKKEELNDYLPLSGGTLTGGLEFRYHATKNGLGFAPNDSISFNALQLGIFANNGFSPYINFGSTGNVFIHPTYDNTTDIGSRYNRWKSVYATKLNNGADITIPTEGGTLARLEDLENIGALPDQTDNAGKFLTTDGTTASWSDKPLVNKAAGTNSLAVLGSVSDSSQYTTVVGSGAASRGGNNSTVVGSKSQCRYSSTLIGAWIQNSIAKNAVILGSGNTSQQIPAVEDNSITWVLSGVEYKLFSADGTIPAERIGNLDFGTMD